MSDRTAQDDEALPQLEDALTSRERAARTKRRRTVARLREATAALFDNETDRPVSAEEVAQVAGVSMATLYSVWATRAQMYYWTHLDLIVDPLDAEVESFRNQPEPLAAVLTRLVDLCKNRRALLRGVLAGSYGVKGWDGKPDKASRSRSDWNEPSIIWDPIEGGVWGPVFRAVAPEFEYASAYFRERPAASTTLKMVTSQAVHSLADDYLVDVPLLVRIYKAAAALDTPPADQPNDTSTSEKIIGT